MILHAAVYIQRNELCKKNTILIKWICFRNQRWTWQRLTVAEVKTFAEQNVFQVETSFAVYFAEVRNATRGVCGM